MDQQFWRPNLNIFNKLVDNSDQHLSSLLISLCICICICICISLSLSPSLSVLTDIFQVNLDYPVFIEAKDDGGGGDNWTTGAISRAKLQSNHHHRQTNIQFFYRPDALPVTQPTVSKHWREKITFHGIAYPKLTWGSSNFVWPLIAAHFCIIKQQNNKNNRSELDF